MVWCGLVVAVNFVLTIYKNTEASFWVSLLYDYTRQNYLLGP